MKNNLFNKILIILFVFVFCFISFPVYSSSFTEEEQAEINEIVAILRANSKNQSATWPIDDNNTKKAYFSTNFEYNGSICSYIVVMYWRDQCSVTFTDGVVVGKNIDYARHDFSVYYYDSDMNCLGAKCNNLNSGSSISISGVNSYFYSEFTIRDSFGNVVEPYYKPRFVNPFFITTEEQLASGKFETLRIDAGSLDYDTDVFLLYIYDVLYVDENKPYYNANKYFVLDKNSPYRNIGNLDIYYYIPFSSLGIDFSNGKQYAFSLCTVTGDVEYSLVEFTVGGLTAEEEEKNKDNLTFQKMDEQTGAIKEQTEVSKNIFQSILEVLSYINPFSENFFVYKLIELLGDLLKSLFVPSSDFMSQWFTDISDYFADAFGILYYPVDLVISVLGRFDGIQGQDPVITFGDLKLFDVVLISGFTYNFNDILVNNTFANIHNFYLITIDVILWLGLLVFCKNVMANVFGGKFIDEVIDDVSSDERSYQNYARHRKNVQRYKNENGGR